MARNDSVDRTTVRNQPRTENNIADAEAHNERQKSCYRNEDIVPGLSRILCKRSPRVQTAETGMRRQRSDRCRLFSILRLDGRITHHGLIFLFGTFVITLPVATISGQGGFHTPVHSFGKTRN